jgi:hypothetical protein
MFDWVSFFVGIGTTALVETIVIILVSEPTRQALFKLISRVGNWLRNPDVEALASRVFDVESVPEEVLGVRPSSYLRERIAGSLRAAGLAESREGARSVEFELPLRHYHVKCIVSPIDESPEEPLALKVSIRAKVAYKTVPRDLFAVSGLETRIVEALTAQLHLRPRGWSVHVTFPEKIRPLSFVDMDTVEYVSGHTRDQGVSLKVGQRSIEAEGMQGDSLERVLRVVIARSPKGGAGPS